jgi:hypothetical protein
MASYLPNALFSPLLTSLCLGIDKFIVLFQMTKYTMWLLEISLDVHVFTLLKCWQVLWVLMECMCIVNMCIMYCRWSCFVGSRKSSFIIAHGVGMKFNICWNISKFLNSCDSTLKSHSYTSLYLARLCRKLNTNFGPFVIFFTLSLLNHYRVMFIYV